MNSNKVTQLADHLNAQVMNHKHYTTIETKNRSSSQYERHHLYHIHDRRYYKSLLYLTSLICHQTRQIHGPKKQSFTICFILVMVVFVLISVAIYLLPYFVLGNNSWSFVMTWLPAHAKWALFSFYSCIILITILLVIIILSQKRTLHSN